MKDLRSDGQYIVEFGGFKIIDVGLLGHHIIAKEISHKPAKCIAKGKKISSVGITVRVGVRFVYYRLYLCGFIIAAYKFTVFEFHGMIEQFIKTHDGPPFDHIIIY